MKTKIFILSLSAFLCFTISNAQKKKSKDMDYYVTKNHDTTFCTKLDYGMSAKTLDELKYVDQSGSKVKIKGEEEVADVVTLFMDGQTWELLPKHIDKPNEKLYMMWQRDYDGKFKLYHRAVSSGGSYMYFNFIKFPDGKFYDVNKSETSKKYLKPYLFNCKAFADKYQFYMTHLDYDYDLLKKKLPEYESMCPGDDVK